MKKILLFLAFTSFSLMAYAQCDPPVATASSNSPVCTGGTASLLSGGGTSYSWTGPNGFTSTKQNPTVSMFALIKAGTYTVTVTNACGSNTATTDVDMNPKPTATVSGGGSVCIGDALPDVSIAMTGTGPWNLTYAVNGINQTPVEGIVSSPYIISGAEAGKYTVKLLSDANCSQSVFTPSGSATVTVNPYPDASVSPVDTTICSGGKTSIKLISNLNLVSWRFTPEVTGGTVTGVMPGTSLAAAASIMQTITNTGSSVALVTYTVTATKNGCSSTTAATVHVNPRPKGAAAPATSAICSAVKTGIQLNDVAGVSGTTFTWSSIPDATITGSPSSCSSGCEEVITDSLYNTGVANAYVNYNITPWANGCAGTAFKAKITVRPVPVASTNAFTSPMCSGTKTNIILSSTTPATNYSWPTPSVINPIGGGMIVGEIAGSGSKISQALKDSAGSNEGTVTYTITPVYLGCPGAPVVAAVTVNPVPTGSASQPSSAICSGSSTNITLTPGSVANTTFTWTAGYGVSISGTPPSSCSSGCEPSIDDALTNIGTGNTKVIYAITPWANGCPGKVIKDTITVRDVAVPFTTLPVSSVCNGGATKIPVHSFYGGTGYSITGEVTTPPDNGDITGFRDTSIADVRLMPIVQKLYNSGKSPGIVTYTITRNYNECVGASVTATVRVNPIPRGTASSSISGICSGNSAGITLTPDFDGVKFTWIAYKSSYIGGGQTCSDTTGGCGTAISNTLVTTSTAAPKQTYVVFPWINACVGPQFNVNITVQSGIPAKPVISGQTSGICFSPVSYNYVVTNLAAFNTVNWILPAGCTMVSHTQSYDQISITYPSGYHADSVKANVTNLCGNTGATGFLKTAPAGSPCRISGAEPEVAVTTGMMAYPNPAHDKLFVEVNLPAGQAGSDRNKECAIRMIDITGRVVINKNTFVAAGQNRIELGLSGLARGLYILSFNSGAETRQVRVVVE